MIVTSARRIGLSFAAVMFLQLTGCVVPHQPVAVIYFEDGKAAESQLRVIARDLTVKYDMRFHEERHDYERERWESDGFTFFWATNDGWLLRLALVKGSEPTFSLYHGLQRTRLSISGPPDNPDVHRLVADWKAALDETEIKYTLEMRTPPPGGPD